jgi:hypothetical protein
MSKFEKYARIWYNTVKKFKVEGEMRWRIPEKNNIEGAWL